MHRLLRIAKSGVRPAVGQVRCAFDNLGDRLVMLAVERLLPTASIISYHPSDKLSRLARFRYGMLGGGTLIFTPQNVGWIDALQDLLDRSTPLCTFGTGVVDPEFVASVYHSEERESPTSAAVIGNWVKLLDRFPIVGVRGVESVRILREHGFDRAEAVGDPAVVFAQNEVRRKTRRRRIGVNVLNESFFWPGSKQRSLQQMERFIADLVASKWEVSLFPAAKSDLVLSREIAARVGLQVRDEIGTPQSYIDAISEMDVFVGMRLHSFIAACCSYTPSIMVGYQPKCVDFCRTAGLEQYHVPTDRLNSTELLAAVESLYDSAELVQAELFHKIQAMKLSLETIAQRVTGFMRWGIAKSLSPDWDDRTKLIASFIPPGMSVLEFGAGRMVLKKFLPLGCTYTPSDIVDRGDSTLVCDLNAISLPDFPQHDVAVFSGVLEYVNDIPRLIGRLASRVNLVAASYVDSGSASEGRLKHGWVNAYSAEEFKELFQRHGFTLLKASDWNNQRAYLFGKAGANAVSPI